MPSEDEARIREEAEKAKSYFAKMPGFEQSNAGRPPAPPAAQPQQPGGFVPPDKEEAPLSEAEKAWKKLMGK